MEISVENLHASVKEQQRDYIDCGLKSLLHSPNPCLILIYGTEKPLAEMYSYYPFLLEGRFFLTPLPGNLTDTTNALTF